MNRTIVSSLLQYNVGVEHVVLPDTNIALRAVLIKVDKPHLSFQNLDSDIEPVIDTVIGVDPEISQKGTRIAAEAIYQLLSAQLNPAKQAVLRDETAGVPQTNEHYGVSRFKS